MKYIDKDFFETIAAIKRVQAEQKQAEFYFKSPELIPPSELRFNAFILLKRPQNARIIILGQDPYPRRESANGLSFCDAGSRLLCDKAQSVSMRNILKTIILDSNGIMCQGMEQVRQMVEKHFKFKKTTDYFTEMAENCGVFFINSSLTFENKETTKKHAEFWKPIVLAAINDCVEQSNGVVLVLFGKFAQQFAKLLDVREKSKLKIVETEHPMNFSFCKSACFQEIQRCEQELGIGVTDWEECCVIR